MKIQNSHNSGFTLIELLVVIAIISIIAAILFPVFATAREKARATSCTSNLKQLGMAFQQYMQDYDEHLTTDPVDGTYGVGWAGAIQPYVKSADAFKCPDDTTGTMNRVVSGKTYAMSPVSYACNMALVLSRQAYRGIGSDMTKLTAPSKTVQLYEITRSQTLFYGNASGYNVADLSTPNEAGGAEYLNYDAYSSVGNGFFVGNVHMNMIQATGYMGGAKRGIQGVNTPDNYTGLDGRHSVGSNFLLCDGHVKWLRGDSVSNGVYLNSLNGSTETLSTDKQDMRANLVCAGTESPEGWAATFCPI